MPTDLYLDTARFGRMIPRARAALDDFASLCTVEGGSLRLLDILNGQNEPDSIGAWCGVAGLAASLRSLVNAAVDSRVLVAQRSLSLARIVARAMFRRCERVLTTDLDWPRYRSLLEVESQRSGGKLINVPVRDLILRERLSSEELVRLLTGEFRANHCDGLFLSDVSFEGIRLPVAGVLDALSHSRGLKFVAVDGAQAVGHVPRERENLACDAYLAGCHKWLGAGQTLAFLVCPRSRSRGLVEGALTEMVRLGEIDDPLLLLLMELEGTPTQMAGDTADLACLFSGAAAVAQAKLAETENRFEVSRENADQVAALARRSFWRPILIHSTLSSGIQLLEAIREDTRTAMAESVRRRYQDQGIALTAYTGGMLRLSMPSIPLASGEIDALGKVLHYIE